ncbi:MAG: phosphoenolpyruvate synthase [Caldilineaceae bacterium SB0662_bin_9]|uniref:Phosphoenolpyruvate synthase n=1 Tax=Caldilineaceae bacterium SB0662_bin_9 TaxID=2605258 RepID=A0A6B1DWX5_9CHLR|nr:phosphoenolpyruvate synthase [Caldilineaceae bacterium SB0662_bin_9]
MFPRREPQKTDHEFYSASQSFPGHNPMYCIPLNTYRISLARVGGKGLNLTKLTQAGFPVPGGFIITTDGYEAFVKSAGITGWMATEADRIDMSDPDAVAALSERIRARFRTGTMTQELTAQIRAAYDDLGRPKVAVRSSATAEDLPGMSFAGQQDTFLNVLGKDALLTAVIDCFSSLWSARAISYRARNGIEQSEVSLAVIVQEMVQSEASGVLFTANPVTGRRTESVIDATFGLGEALVGGQVEPDHYVVETGTGRVLEEHVGAKATIIRGLAEGGTETVQEGDQPTRALTDAQIDMLVDLGRRVATLYAFPQDIEWAFADGDLLLLQARPITTLFPLPRMAEADHLRVFVSLGTVQGVLDPFTPLGQEMLKGLFAGLCRVFGRQATIFDQPIVHIAGARPWIEATSALRNPLGRRMFLNAFPLLDPGIAEAVRALANDSRLLMGTMRLSSLARFAPVMSRILRSLLFALLQPEAALRQAQASVEDLVTVIEKQVHLAGTLQQRLTLFEWLGHQVLFPRAFLRLAPLIAAGYASLSVLGRLTARLEADNPDLPPRLYMELTKSLDNNVTTDMDLELWQTARRIREDAQACAEFEAASPEDLARDFHSRKLPDPVQQALTDFLDRYGMRGLAEIDFGRPRWRERPLPIIRALQSYLAIADANLMPDQVFQRGQLAAQEAAACLAEAAAKRWRSPAAGSLVRWLVRRVRTLAGFRESPKFLFIRLMDMVRTALLDSGQELAAAGVIQRADDLFFLRLEELKVLAMCTDGDWKKLVASRRAAHAGEMHRKPIPRLLLSDGTAIYAGLVNPSEADDRTIVGSGVSSGTVEGTVHVVFDPNHAQLQPGEILVCPGTDPSWTPLFLAAGGLVMEVGGMMTHGSVVAREYGIPAVVGVDRATERLQTGQQVRVDGSSGHIQLLG